MNISKFKLVTTFLFGGGVSGVIEYLLGVLKAALAGLSDTTKEKVQAVLNLALKVLSILEVIKCLVPTKWQTAYVKTLVAVQTVVESLTDLEITKDELDVICDRVTAAIDAWKSPDDETCVELKCIDGVYQAG